MNTTDVIEPAAPVADLSLPRRATFDDLMRTEGRAELIGGKIVKLTASGDAPSGIGFEIALSLRDYAKARGVGIARADGTGYALPSPLPVRGRESFQPDASYFTGARPVNKMRCFGDAPAFAVEVRSENDYGRAAERDMAEKQADYFAAGTLVVWDVDPMASTIAVYRKETPEQPMIYRRGDIAEAEPAAPGWRMAVDGVFAD